ncbi:MAG: phosphatidylserine/phosphatidylglycerophosphate/cardiolipin synthase family protein [Azoarcus sp.]|jgi:phosphatidylserine/phosphatidylglycerophosphate/cardiolipin synthase-like enzyme|nr:phosphatidylserine/phosphatidylglycerophosphate/cardiolipin synthase family protein [Azoarcus sp.]
MTLECTAVGLLSERDVDLTMPWFSNKSRYAPRPSNTVKPLINGEHTFEALQKAIEKATRSIEIITWGFDPSMRLKPPLGPRLGELLRQKAQAGVAVRILVWKNGLANFKENNIIGDGLLGSGGGSAGAGSGMGSTSARDAGSGGDTPYGSAISGTGSAGIKTGDSEARAFNRDWFATKHEKLSFRTRDFGLLPVRLLIAYEMLPFIGTQKAAFLATASHHQKMVLIDYEAPDSATGFVMGHNMLRHYWDRDAHECSDKLRLGFGPWQDLSAQMWGEVLWCLNENFSTAWGKAQPWIGSDQPLPESRKGIKPQVFAKPADGCMAQICRTQPEEGDRSIEDLYRVVLANARKYVYIENQYFRHTELAMHLRELYRKLKAGGWKEELYVFVVTNVPDGHGRLNTYDTLNALGKAEQMPKINEQQQGKNPDSKETKEIREHDLEGMNIHVCTLCSSGWTQEQPSVMWGGGAGPMGLPSASVYAPPPQVVYRDIYVHSKLLLIDDKFFTLGSANFNKRSMENDSELNIAVPSPKLTKEWRQKLWRLHTKQEPGDDIEKEFGNWGKLMRDNKQIQEDKENPKPLKAPLIEFFDNATSGWAID